MIEFSTPSVNVEIFKSKVSFIDPLINPKTRSATVRVEISNTKQLLKPEMFVTGNLIPNSKSNQQLTVPKSAVLWTGERSVVYVKIPELKIPSYEFHEVVLGKAIGDNYVVISGIKVGDEVVTNGAFVIDASAQLNNQSSMMNRNIEPNNEEMKCDGSMDMNSEGKSSKTDKGMKCEAGKCGSGM